MARSDLLINLVKAGSSGNNSLFKNTVNAIIAEERSKQHHALVDKLVQTMNESTPINDVSSFGNLGKNSHLLTQYSSTVSLNDIWLEEGSRQIVDEVIEEHQRIELLRSYSLEPRNRIILIGPPGNGKTTLASAIADKLMIPIFTINYAGIIGSYLGETTSRLAKVLDYVKTQHCVLFVDEFETIAKERGDQHETGEIKRVVSTLLLEIDRLPSHVIVIAASNHPELLDRAIWRRFPVKLNLTSPALSQIKTFLESNLRDVFLLDEHLLNEVSKKLKGFSYSDIENFCLDIKRRTILSGPNADCEKIINKQLTRLGKVASK